MAYRTWWMGWVGLCAVMAACGPTVGVDGDDGDDGGETSETSDVTETETDSITGADESSSDSGEEICEALLDEAVLGSSTVVLRNDTDEVLFVGFDGGCSTMPFRMTDADDVSVQWKSGDCAMSCEDMLAQDCFWCGACLGPSIVRIAPGEQWEREWTGGWYERLEFPAECSAEQPCEESCERRAGAPAGEYLLRTEARTECPADDPTLCECPDGESPCTVVLEGGIPMATVETTAVLAHPGGSAELVFE